ncbi:hypothetical protein [Pontiella sulfatireligans]|uniref:hypothetical protein n=1 Tax=Pontiella sulfatireligans TaxID=2750658 RepID=UPI00109CF93F|nr:hypothetical protein [Pontiella sulfatireligans]
MELYCYDRSLKENGFETAGFNWSRRNGITTPDIPVKNNRLVSRYYGTIGANFANGASLDHKNGLFATQIDNGADSKRLAFPGCFINDQFF